MSSPSTKGSSPKKTAPDRDAMSAVAASPVAAGGKGGADLPTVGAAPGGAALAASTSGSAGEPSEENKNKRPFDEREKGESGGSDKMPASKEDGENPRTKEVEEEEDSSTASPTHPTKRPRRYESSDSSVILLGTKAPESGGTIIDHGTKPEAAKGLGRGEPKKDDEGADEEERDDDVVSSAAPFVHYEWLDEGELEQHESGLRRVHQGIWIGNSGPRGSGDKKKDETATTTGHEKPAVGEIRIGDVVQMANPGDSPDEEERDEDVWLCRVTGFFSAVETEGGDDDDASSDPVLEGEWLFGSRDLSEVAGANSDARWRGIMGRDQLVTALWPRERVWTNNIDVNPVSSVLRKVNVVYLDRSTTWSALMDLQLPPGSFLVRYKVCLSPGAWTVMPWNATDREAARYASQSPPFARRVEDAMDAESLSSAPSSDSSGEDDDDESSASSLESDDDRDLVAMPEGEGSSLRAKISVGPKHQVPVAAFVEGATVRSRNPTLVWSASTSRITDEEMHDFCVGLARILNPYQQRRGLVMMEPYNPLPADKAEQEALRDAHFYDIKTLQLVQLANGPWIRTGSHVSSAGRVSKKANPLLKECNVDALLGFVHRHNYDTKAALAEAENNPNTVLDELTTAFTLSEKKVFDDNFRLTSGSMRKVADAMELPLTEVLDYWYRFKIPEQFRVYQDKKREKALRMMECIEKRGYTDSAKASYSLPGSLQTFPVTSTRQGTNDHWSEKLPADVTGAVAERLRSAKNVLLEVKHRCGSKGWKRISSLILDLHDSYDSSTRDELFDALDEYPDLQRKLQAFIP